ncbi:MAG: non-homologous end-joining DNA ligase [Planctomycetaceae bacterium]|nr:non-homologous end-joining DNA ligase [Planctomycetaceae bacterium]
MTTVQAYNQKRHFDKTAEPRGKKARKRTKKLRFVVQHHVARRDHFDFRLEWDGVLKSWAVPKGPSYSSRDKRLAVQVEDHPYDYRDFEGTIPKGEYGGGTVMIWDEGYWSPTVDAEDGLKNGSLKFVLDGNRLKGAWALVRMAPKPADKTVNWLLIKERDEFENAFDIGQWTTSSRSGRTMEEIGESGNDEPEDAMSSSAKKPSSKTAAAETGSPKKTAKKPAAKKAASPAKQTPAKAAGPTGNGPLVLEGVTITNPGKVLYKDSGVTKGDVARYYQAVAERMLPYMEKRILSAVRCPSGIERACFYKKHPANDSPGVVKIPVPGDGKTEEYFYIEDVRGLMTEVQMNTLEFHAWGSRVESLEKSDMMVFDLDPDVGMDLDRIRQGVRDLKSILDQLSITSFLKTSGGKGYHVVIPFRAKTTWDNFHTFAQNTAKTMEAMWPDRYTSNVRKNQRNNRIFIDWMRNGRGATSIAPYSVRAREGAPVSVPISWRELNTVTPNGFGMADAIARLRRKDPWADFFTIKQQLK